MTLFVVCCESQGEKCQNMLLDNFVGKHMPSPKQAMLNSSFIKELSHRCNYRLKIFKVI